jgi:hypothetical protein
VSLCELIKDGPSVSGGMPLALEITVLDFGICAFCFSKCIYLKAATRPPRS